MFMFRQSVRFICAFTIYAASAVPKLPGKDAVFRFIPAEAENGCAGSIFDMFQKFLHTEVRRHAGS